MSVVGLSSGVAMIAVGAVRLFAIVVCMLLVGGLRRVVSRLNPVRCRAAAQCRAGDGTAMATNPTSIDTRLRVLLA